MLFIGSGAWKGLATLSTLNCQFRAHQEHASIVKQVKLEPCSSFVWIAIVNQIMDKEGELQSSHVIDDREQYLVDRDRDVCDPFLSVGSVSVSKETLWYYNS